MATSFTFTQVGDKYESNAVQFESDTVVRLTFSSVPDFTGVGIEFWQSLPQTDVQSLTADDWQLCYDEALRTGLTWCKALTGVSEKAYYKIVCSVNPTTALYE